MYSVSVIPITRGLKKETLTYYSRHTFVPGVIITVPLRSRDVPALVVSVRDAKQDKAQLRAADFVARKITRKKADQVMTQACIEAVHASARFHAASLGAVIKALIPKSIITDPPKLSLQSTSDTPVVTPAVEVFQDTDDVRLSRYKAMVRESFARNESLLILTPNRLEAEKVYATLVRGLEQHAFLLHSQLSKKKIHTLWRQLVTAQHPVLVVVTPQFLSIPRSDIGTLIIEREASRAYKSIRQPFLDYRFCARALGRALGARVILADTLLRLQTLWEWKTGGVSEVTRPKMRYHARAETSIVDMRQYPTLPLRGLPLLSDQLRDMITYVQTSGEHVFVFTSRKGLFPLTVCSDCGNTVMCHVCDAPLVIYGKQTEATTEYVCHRCSAHTTTSKLCSSCSSWNLTTLGIGIELIEKALREVFPDVPCIRVDSTTTKTPTQVRRAFTQWQKEPGSVLLGTTLALPYLEDVPYSVIASLDSLFSLPDYAIQEKIFGLLMHIRAHTQRDMVIQTRHPEHPALALARDGDVARFYREEIAQREEVSYPPFTRFIKITAKGTESAIKKYIEILRETLAPWQPSIYPAFAKRIKNQHIFHALIEIPHDEWPDDELLAALHTLPPSFIIDVEPDTTL